MTKVSIGIPVYNEINYIKHTLNSVLEQDAHEIIISDNASTDGSSEICAEYASKYPSIKYHRYDTPQPVHDNFLNCVLLAKHDYYMFMGGHDLLSRNYVTELKNFLDNTDCVMAYTNAVHLSNQYAFIREYVYHFAHLLNDEQASVRVMASIEYLSDCTLYYGLHRKDIFLATYMKLKKSKYNGIDHAHLSQIAAMGKMSICPNATFYRLDPPRKEEIVEQWARVLKAIYAENYDAQKHVPELIALGVVYNQFLIAKSLMQDSADNIRYLTNVAEILFRRWMLNEAAVELIVQEMYPLLQQSGIDISSIKLDG